MALWGIREFDAFARAYAQIMDKNGHPVKWAPNESQRRIQAAIAEQEDAGQPIRLRVLKYRQAGVSLWSTLWCLTRTIGNTGHGCISVADKQSLVEKWVERCRWWLKSFRQLPIRLDVGAENANEIFCRNLQSRYYIGSAEGKTPGMGDTLATIHCSELAFWNDPEKIWRQISPGLPPGPHTAVIQESVGLCAGDWWFERYHEAKAGDSGYKALFLPWYIQPEYQLDADDILAYTPKERGLLALGLTDRQLAWRRWQIATEFHHDEVAFANAYPANEDEAFLAAGRNVFTPDEVAKAKETVREPIWRGEIIPKRNPAEFELIGSDGGRLLIWEHPQAGKHYAIGADCQWGPRSESDFDAFFVECIETGKVVARFHGKAEMGEYAKTLAACGHYYNQAVLAPERNSAAARGVILPLLGLAGNDWSYPALYVRERHGRFGTPTPEDYGWLTDEHTKPEMVMYCHQMLGDGRMDWADSGAVSEMSAYIVDAKSKMTAPPGLHDDLLMSRMITAKVAAQARALLTVAVVNDASPFRSTEDRVREMLSQEEDEE